ncbi:hypothetical protein SLEP1_g59539, partial [Rubroshorea leprosula]
VPLSLEAQAEARLLMFSHMNLLSPAIGDPISVPTQDMLIGLYVLTSGNRRGICANRKLAMGIDLKPSLLRNTGEYGSNGRKKGTTGTATLPGGDKDKWLATELDALNRTHGAVIEDAAKKEERLAVKLARSLLPYDFKHLRSCYQIISCHPSSVVNRVGDTYRYPAGVPVRVFAKASSLPGLLKGKGLLPSFFLNYAFSSGAVGVVVSIQPVLVYSQPEASIMTTWILRQKEARDKMPSPYQYFSKSIALTASSFASAFDVPGLGLSFLSAVSLKPAIAFGGPLLLFLLLGRAAAISAVGEKESASPVLVVAFASAFPS